jgi:folate-binding Fe-S cluster repair protein YgfZ
MKHKTELKKGLVQLRIDGDAAPGTPITLEDGRDAGRLGTVAGGMALAHLRFDRLAGPLRAGSAVLRAVTDPVTG